MISEYERLGKEISTIQARLKQLPEGKLLCTRNGTHIKWYHSDGHIQTYIPKKNRQFAEQLAERRYLTLLLEEDMQEQKAIQMYLKHHPKSGADELLKATSTYQELLSNVFQSTSQQIKSWINSPYEKNELYPERLKFETYFGISVRSKSEAIIAMTLQNNKIPFRYECALEIGNIKIYPDFTIIHPGIGEIFYWEHFGMMDMEKYARQAVSKLKLYMENGYLISQNLIITSETREKPFTPMDAEKVIQRYFT